MNKLQQLIDLLVVQYPSRTIKSHIEKRAPLYHANKGKDTLLLQVAAGLFTLGCLLLMIGGNQIGFHTLQTISDLLPDGAWAHITFAGDTLLGLAFFLFVAVRFPHLILALFFAAILGTLVTHGFKPLFAIPRPAAFLDPETFKIIGPRLSSHNSMPSGHTLSAFVVAGLMLRVCTSLKQRVWVLIAAGFVAWSRVAVGAHWPVDTLMGATGGLVCAWAGLKISDRFADGYTWKGYIAISVLLMACAIALPYHDGGYAGVELFAFTVSACAIFYWLAGMYEEELLPSVRLKEAPRIFPYSNKFDPSFNAEILVTGAAGFIGFHVCQRLIDDGYKVVGIDGINDYYSPKLKRDRISILRESDNFRFIRMDIAEPGRVEKLFDTYRFDKVIHLAAQAGARHSIKKPFDYAHSNVTGTLTILEGCKKYKIKHLLYASSSSLYGNNTKIPFSVKDPVDHPASLYAATKKSNELMAHSYSHLYGIPTTGLRFFTVYGPWGRPDMAPMIFTKAIMEGKPIKVFNHGKLSRDFTYIDDIVEGIVRLLDKVPQPNPEWDGDRDSSDAPYRIYNIGNHQPVQLEDFIGAIEKAVGKKAIKEYLPMQLGDVHTTYADTDTLRSDVGFDPSTPIDEGIQKFVDWYKDYYEQNEKR